MISNDTIRKTIITTYFWFWISVGTLLTMIINFIGILLGMEPHVQRRFIEIFIAEFPSTMMELIGFWEIEYVYDFDMSDVSDMDEYYHVNESYVIVSNHTSVIDTMFTAQLPFTKVFTWNKKWAYTPGFGWLCYLAEHIAIDKSSSKSRESAITQSLDMLKMGYSIIFYPEGTRNRNPSKNILLPFKTGAFRVALESGKRILPVTLVGTNDACNGFVCDYAKIKIIVNHPITMIRSEYNIRSQIESSEYNIETTMEHVRTIMIDNISQ